MVAAGTVVAVLTIMLPAVLAENTFLETFITHEILGLLAVVLTITLASVVNIHLMLSQIVRKRFADSSAGRLAVSPARMEVNSSAWSLFWAFLVCVVILLLKGGLPINPYTRSLLNGSAMMVLLFSLLVLHDIYQTVFDLAERTDVDDAIDGAGK